MDGEKNWMAYSHSTELYKVEIMDLTPHWSLHYLEATKMNELIGRNMC